MDSVCMCAVTKSLISSTALRNLYCDELAALLLGTKLGAIVSGTTFACTGAGCCALAIVESSSIVAAAIYGSTCFALGAKLGAAGGLFRGSRSLAWVSFQPTARLVTSTTDVASAWLGNAAAGVAGFWYAICMKPLFSSESSRAWTSPIDGSRVMYTLESVWPSITVSKVRMLRGSSESGFNAAALPAVVRI